MGENTLWTEIALRETSSMPPNSRPKPIPDPDEDEHYAIWVPADYISGPRIVTIFKKWQQHNIDNEYCRVVQELYAFPTKYKLVVPDKGAKVTDCLAGHIVVYALMLNLGCVFPCK